MAEHRAGLGYYRRLRPFTIKDWWVVDIATEERIGYLRDTYDVDGEGYAIELTTASVSSDKMMAVNEALKNEISAWVLADRLWKLAYPIKSRAWLVLRAIVQTSDWLLGFATTAFRLAGVALVVAFIIGSLGFLWEARGLLKDIGIEWLEGARTAEISADATTSTPDSGQAL